MARRSSQPDPLWIEFPPVWPEIESAQTGAYDDRRAVLITDPFPRRRCPEPPKVLRVVSAVRR